MVMSASIMFKDMIHRLDLPKVDLLLVRSATTGKRPCRDRRHAGSRHIRVATAALAETTSVTALSMPDDRQRAINDYSTGIVTTMGAIAGYSNGTDTQDELVVLGTW
jgi:hypothetical protein